MRKQAHRIAVRCRVAFGIDLHAAAKITGCAHPSFYLDCERLGRRPPLGWTPLFDTFRNHLKTHMTFTPWPPRILLLREAYWIIDGCE